MTLPAAGGVLPVDKPAGPTSHDVVALARQALGTRRVGHTGTLDPFATGLLLLCVGPATRLSPWLTGLDKAYEATAVLGVRTETDDPEGAVVATDERWRAAGRAGVEAALAGLVGRIGQVPPTFSAKKVGGEAAYRRARRGEAVTLAAVEVEVHALELVELALPELRFRARCSSGTYVRALARDLGAALGTGAHLTELRRTHVGAFRVDTALTPDALHDPDAVAAAWVEPVRALAHLPRLEVSGQDAARLAHGQAVAMPRALPSSDVAVEHGAGPAAEHAAERTATQDQPRPPTSAQSRSRVAVAVRDGELVAIGEVIGDALHPRKVFREAAT